MRPAEVKGNDEGKMDLSEIREEYRLKRESEVDSIA